ncbi:iron chelate uptake ABC transporter family permease subunit [Corynebacterium sp. 4HC-13]|uniref:iron chelate uptake ABC transporter family permease subunit n=1 Tax=Corynebacterium anserum TaxID=2684406 RepID=UPI00163A902F|nr:iron chelate uptake ABC transporter family permease subunit [Corynebacterium anserum]MBC2682229.1 iron chelate uptake ABC transporter family permease subunit [Corynebacterium anserum]
MAVGNNSAETKGNTSAETTDNNRLGNTENQDKLGRSHMLSQTRTLLITGVLFIGLVAVGAGSLFAGLHDAPTVVITQIRAPRLAMAVVGGAATGAAGVLLQEGMGNRLAVPEMLGVSSGAAAAICAVVVLGLPVPLVAHSAVALGGGLLAGLAVWWGARTARTAIEVLLVGAAVSSAAGALVLIFVGSAGETQLRALLRYLQGSLNELYWNDVTPTLIALVIGLPFLWFLVPGLELLRLSDDTVRTLGAHPERLRGVILLVAAVLVALSVGPAGPLSWVGFLGPMLARLLTPHAGIRAWLPLGSIAGALIAVAADWLARSAFAPVETPVGGWTGVVAALVVIGVLVTGRRL